MDKSKRLNFSKGELVCSPNLSSHFNIVDALDFALENFNDNNELLVIENADFSGKDISGKDYSNMKFINCSFDGAKATEVDFTGCVFEQVYMRATDLRGSDLQGVDLSSIDNLDYAKFTGVKVTASRKNMTMLENLRQYGAKNAKLYGGMGEQVRPEPFVTDLRDTTKLVPVLG